MSSSDRCLWPRPSQKNKVQWCRNDAMFILFQIFLMGSFVSSLGRRFASENTDASSRRREREDTPPPINLPTNEQESQDLSQDNQRRTRRRVENDASNTANIEFDDRVHEHIPLRRSPRIRSSRARRLLHQNLLQQRALSNAITNAATGTGELDTTDVHHSAFLREALESIVFNIMHEEANLNRNRAENGPVMQVGSFYYCGHFLVGVESQRRHRSQESTVGQEELEQYQRQRHERPMINAEGEHLHDFMSRYVDYMNSPGIERTRTRSPHPSANQTMIELSYALNDEHSPTSTEIEIPLMVLGTRDETRARAQLRSQGEEGTNMNGWVMYVIGGSETTAAMRRLSLQISRQAQFHLSEMVGGLVREDGMPVGVAGQAIPVVHGMNGRFIIGHEVRNEDPNRAVVNSSARLAQFLSRLLLMDSTNPNTDLNVTTTNANSNTENDTEPRPLLRGGSFATFLSTIISAMLETNGEEETDSSALYDLLIQLDAGIRRRHISQSLIDEKLPVITYDTGSAELAPTLTRCPICLVDWEDGDKLRSLSCSHMFHKDCVDTWLTKHVGSCPLCRLPAIPRGNESQDDGENDASRQNTTLNASDP